jgi:hypothetical protein
MSAPAKLNQGLRLFFSEFVRVSLRHPSQAVFFARTIFWQGRAARLRARMAREGVHVPPIAIFSITNKCNLPFKGGRKDNRGFWNLAPCPSLFSLDGY